MSTVFGKGDNMIDIVIVVLLVVNLVLVLYLLFSKSQPKKLDETKETDEERDMRKHLDALLNYTPQVAYKKVKR